MSYSEVIEHNGRQFRVDIVDDDDTTPPWERDHAHGSVRYIDDRESLQRGEVVLYDCDRSRYVYNFGAALLQASREKWGLAPDALQALTQRLGRKPSRGQIRAAAVRADMEYLRQWCADYWSYIGVCVRIIGPDGEPDGDKYAHAMWGVESFGDYWQEVARDIADGILRERGQAWRAALVEAREVKYWCTRDVQTMGA